MNASHGENYSAGIAYVLIATVGWSLSGLFVRLLPGLDGWQINCWRGFSMAVFLSMYLVLIYGTDAFAKLRAIPLIAIATSAGFFAAGSTMYVSALTHASTAVVSVFGTLAPLIAGLLSPWITGDKPSIWSWAGALLAVAGVTVIAGPELMNGNINGMLLSLGYPISFAAQTLALRRYRAVDMTPALCVGGLFSFIVAGFAGGFATPVADLPVIALMGLVQMAIPISFYVMGARAVPAITLSLIVLLDVVLNPFWSWLGTGEIPDARALTGAAVILIAVLLSVLGGAYAQNRRNLAR